MSNETNPPLWWRCVVTLLVALTTAVGACGGGSAGSTGSNTPAPGGTAPVVLAPVNSAAPVLTVTDNATSLLLAASTGTWTNNPTSYTYAWSRDGTLIAGATLPSYNTVTADQGTSVAAVVTATNSGGSASVTSLAVPVPVPTPTTPTAPSLALTATPASIVAGQSSTLTWASSNTTGCTAAGDWNGARATSGSLVVAPPVTAAYTLQCLGPGGSVSANVTVTVTVAAAAPVTSPTLGAHGMVFHGIGGSVGPLLSTPAATTQSGSTMLAFVGKGSLSNLSPPIDNKGNTPYAQLGAIHAYTRWPGQGSAVYAFNAIVGGANHIVSEDDANTFDEVSFATVEVRNGGVVQDIKWNEVLNATLQTSQSVTTTGPATLVAVWYGDDASSTPSNPVPNNGFTVIHGNPNGSQSVQMFVATKDVLTAGTYNVAWTTTPLQGAQLYLVAVQGK